MASSGSGEDKYRSFMSGDGEKNTKWRFGGPPNYDVVNKLFEEGRTQIWPPGSLEEKVQNLVKSWEMEMFHKADPEDFKTADPKKLTLSLNGRKAQSLADVGKIGGGYNFFLQTALPDNLRFYNPEGENFNSALVAFTTTFPRGFAVEIIQVYTGPPLIAYKFRHWGYMEGPFKGHAPTGEMVQFFGIGIFELDENEKIVKVEFFCDRGELLGGLMRGATLQSSGEESSATGCPFMSNTG